MAIYPGAIVRLLTVDKGRKKLTEYNRVNFHVAVSESSSLYNMFNQKGAADSHFYVRRDGTVEQYVDTAWRANADYEGNDATISIETQGGVNNADTEPWTSQQTETLAQIFAWAVKTHGIPVQQASSSKYDNTSRGMSWHRLGIDGNFPSLPDIRAGRQQRGGGMHWSTAFGKLCPGGGKIQQVPSIFARARVIIDGGGPTPTPPDPKPDDGKLTVDGFWGPATTTRLQQFAGTTADGVVSSQAQRDRHVDEGGLPSFQWVSNSSASGSDIIYWIQGRVGVSQDRFVGTNTIKAMQRHFGTTQDGVVSGPSDMVRAMQTSLNAGKF